MGQAISIAEQTPDFGPNKLGLTPNHATPESNNSTKSTPRFSMKSRSNSSNSLSNITCTSHSTTSISGRFVSYETDTSSSIIFYLEPNYNNTKSQTWTIKLISKYYEDQQQQKKDNENVNNESLYYEQSDDDPETNTNQDQYIIFGVCDASLLELGYKHKYYGCGYSVTYCHGIKFMSYSTSFPINKDITIKYDHNKSQISFECENEQKERIITIANHQFNKTAIIIKSYNDLYEIQHAQKL